MPPTARTARSPRGPSWTLLLVALLAVAPVLAGCLGGAGPQVPDDGGAASDGGASDLLPDLSAVAETFDAERGVTWWEGFVTTYAPRHVGTPLNLVASEELRDELDSLGYDSQILYYPGPGGEESPLPVGLRVVVGVKEGTTTPERVVGWVSHYDTNVGTIQGAYDDGSGVAVGMEMARAFADVETNKTLMVVFFDAEEIGLVASDYFVQDVVGDGEARFDLVIGHDMVGVNCPGHDWSMYQMLGGVDHVQALRPVEVALYRDVLGLNATTDADVEAGAEPGCVHILDTHDRNSDERRFKEAGVPILRMAGGRNASDYPAYHRYDDTVEYAYGFVEGRDNFVAGLEMVLRTTYWNVHAFDRIDMDALLAGS